MSPKTIASHNFTLKKSKNKDKLRDFDDLFRLREYSRHKTLMGSSLIAPDEEEPHPRWGRASPQMRRNLAVSSRKGLVAPG
jgi:hypothetical protein